jgi:hypothetical protein
MLIFGIVLAAASAAWMLAMYVWAFWEWNADAGQKPPEDWAPVRHVSSRYLVMAAVGTIVGALLIATSAR